MAQLYNLPIHSILKTVDSNNTTISDNVIINNDIDQEIIIQIINISTTQRIKFSTNSHLALSFINDQNNSPLSITERTSGFSYSASVKGQPSSTIKVSTAKKNEATFTISNKFFLDTGEYIEISIKNFSSKKPPKYLNNAITLNYTNVEGIITATNKSIKYVNYQQFIAAYLQGISFQGNAIKFSHYLNINPSTSLNSSKVLLNKLLLETVIDINSFTSSDYINNIKQKRFEFGQFGGSNELLLYNLKTSIVDGQPVIEFKNPQPSKVGIRLGQDITLYSFSNNNGSLTSTKVLDITGGYGKVQLELLNTNSNRESFTINYCSTSNLTHLNAQTYSINKNKFNIDRTNYPPGMQAIGQTSVGHGDTLLADGVGSATIQIRKNQRQSSAEILYIYAQSIVSPLPINVSYIQQ